MLAATLDQLTPRQVWQLFKLRVDVFVVEQQCPYEEIDQWDVVAKHVLAFDGENLVGCARLYREELWHLGRLCVAPSHRGTGLGQDIMRHCLGLVDGPVALDAQSPLAAWYEKFGFVVTGPEYDWDGIPHLPMLRK